MIENMLELQPEVVANKLMHADNFIDFLLLMQERESGEIYSFADIVHSASCAELLCTIIQSCDDLYKSKFSLTLKGMERLLCLLNVARTKQLSTEEELGMAEFQFDAIASLLLGLPEQT